MQNNFTSLNGSIHSLFNQSFSFKHLAVLVASVLVVLCAVWLPYALFWQLDGLMSLQQAQIIGSCMFYGGIACFVVVAVVTRFRLSKDWSLKRNVGVFSVLLLVTLVFSSLLSAPVVAALTPLPSDTGPNGSSAFKFSVPFTPYEWFVGEFRDNTYYAINGSDWNIMTIVEPWQPVAPWASLSTNLTALTDQCLSVTSSGVVFLKQVAFDLALMNNIPASVSVVENVNGRERTFINSTDSLGSPYTVTVEGANYFAQDTEHRIYLTSTNSTSLIDSVKTQAPINSTIKLNAGISYATQMLTVDGICFVGTAETALTYGNVVIFNYASNKYTYAAADSSETIDNYVYLTLTNAAIDGNVLLLENGYVANTNWSWSNGSELYIGTGTYNAVGTFGYTSVGTSEFSPLDGATGTNKVGVNGFTYSGTTGYLTSITSYIKPANTTASAEAVKIRALLYSNTGTFQPYQPIAISTDEATLTQASDWAWVQFNVTNHIPITNGEKYWLGGFTNQTRNQGILYKYHTGITGQWKNDVTWTYPTIPPNPYLVSAGFATEASIYATVSVLASGAIVDSYPSESGNIALQIGTALSATDIHFESTKTLLTIA